MNERSSLSSALCLSSFFFSFFVFLVCSELRRLGWNRGRWLGGVVSFSRLSLKDSDWFSLCAPWRAQTVSQFRICPTKCTSFACRSILPRTLLKPSNWNPNGQSSLPCIYMLCHCCPDRITAGWRPKNWLLYLNVSRILERGGNRGKFTLSHGSWEVGWWGVVLTCV